MTYTTTLSRVAVLLMVTLMAFFLLLASGVDAGTPSADSVVYHVQPGDTLWGIAESIAQPGDDVRAVIHDLRRANGLSSSALAIGDRLLLP